MTVLLCLVVIPLGLSGGLALALLSTVKIRIVRWLVVIYVDFFRAFPPLVLLIFIYFGLPFLGVDLPAFVAVALGFMLNTSSYYGEIFRAGIESIPRGQFEGARSTGLNAAQTMTYVIIPQATRNVIPDLISNTLEVVKLTSIASVVALPNSSSPPARPVANV
jgi:polar amino acid transport system permease protein